MPRTRTRFRTRSRLVRPLAAATVATALGAAAGSAVADIDAAWAAPDLWTFEVRHMPDLDQWRDGLVGDGAMHCVPTAAMNIMAYLAAHGRPGLAPGVANWRAPSLHGYMTFWIDQMGQGMGTTLAGGTDGPGTVAGLATWISGVPGDYTIDSIWQNTTWTPTIQDIAPRTGLYGGYTILAGGRYAWQGGVWTRTGGHAVTLMGAARSGNDRQISVRDPATTDGDLTVQSGYTTESYALATSVRSPEGWDPRPMEQIVGLTSAQFIDAAFTITPTYAITSISVFGEDVIATYHPDGADHGVPPQATALPPGSGQICQGVWGPGGDLVMQICPVDPDDPDELYLGDPASGEWTAIALESPLALIRDFAVGRQRVLFVFDPETGLHAWSPDLGQEVGQVTLPSQTQVRGIALEQPSDFGGPESLWAFAPSLETAYRLDPDDLSSPFQTTPMGGADLIGPGARFVHVPGRWRTFIAWRPGDAFVTLLRHTGAFFQASILGSFEDPVDALTAGDGGRVLMSRGGVIKEHRLDESDGLVPVPDEDSRFAGQPAGSLLLISRSTSNFDPELHVGPGWQNVIPSDPDVPSIPDCVADLDFDGEVGFGDLVQMLAVWDEPDPYADIAPDGGDEIVGLDDLLALLASWGPCP